MRRIIHIIRDSYTEYIIMYHWATSSFVKRLVKYIYYFPYKTTKKKTTFNTPNENHDGKQKRVVYTDVAVRKRYK